MSTSLKFTRSIGAKADLAELKYVSALHQTSNELSSDGSIHQSDISALLASKFGIDISDEEVGMYILQGGFSTGNRLTNSTSDSLDNEILDLCELVAMIIIPELIRAVEHDSSHEEVADNAITQDVLNGVLNIMKDTLELDTNANEDVIINSDTMKIILAAVGEEKLAEDTDLIHHMVKQVGGKDDDAKILNVSSFAHALTSDVQAYNDVSLSDIICQPEKKNGILRFARRRPTQVQAESQTIDGKDDGADIDIEDCNVKCEADVSQTADGKDSHVEEGTMQLKKEDVTSIDKTSAKENKAFQPKQIFAAPSIDYFIDAQALHSVAICLWMFLLSHVLASGFFGMQDFPSLVPSDVCPSDTTRTVGCDTGEVILTWIDGILTILIVGGIFIMCIGSLGNYYGASRVSICISLIPVLYFFIKPFTSIGTAPADFSGEYHRQFALILSMLIAVVIVLERVRQVWYRSDRSKFQCCLNNSRMSKLFSRGLTGTTFDSDKPASFKVSRMLQNAFAIIHPTDGKKIDHSSLAAFYQNEQEQQEVGGHLWVWKRMRNGVLYHEEGISFSIRLLAANIMQFMIIIYIILFMMSTTEQFVDSYENNTILVFIRGAQSTANGMIDSLQDLRGTASMAVSSMFKVVLPTIEMLRLDACEALASYETDNIGKPEICYSNYTLLTDLYSQSEDFKALFLASLSQKMEPTKNFLSSIIDAAFEALENTIVVVDPLKPEMIQMAMGIGGLVAFLASIFLATLYLPSVVSTTLRFRCGELPLVPNYRTKLHHITFLTGALFWGTVLYVSVLAFVIAFIILAVIWLVTVLPLVRGSNPPVGGTVLGTIFVFVAQFALFNICTCLMYKGFYRKRPGRSNVHNILWESSWIALSVLFVAVRAVKLTIVAALQIGRIDVPFLAEGVGEICGVKLDRFPDIFRQDILAHEAHNHPYMQRLSKIYLLKIRHGSGFANDAGTCWRLIFVLTLFPWLRQYRMKPIDSSDEHGRIEDAGIKKGCSMLLDCLD